MEGHGQLDRDPRCVGQRRLYLAGGVPEALIPVTGQGGNHLIGRVLTLTARWQWWWVPWLVAKVLGLAASRLLPTAGDKSFLGC